MYFELMMVFDSSLMGVLLPWQIDFVWSSLLLGFEFPQTSGIFSPNTATTRVLKQREPS